MKDESPAFSTEMILNQLVVQRGYLANLVDDLPDERMAEQPGGIVNHPAWQLGHLAFVLDRLIGMLGGAATLESWKDIYGPGTEPRSDRAAYAAKAELICVLDERRAELARVYAQATPQMLGGTN